jgi:hypothetical protein
MAVTMPGRRINPAINTSDYSIANLPVHTFWYGRH